MCSAVDEFHTVNSLQTCLVNNRLPPLFQQFDLPLVAVNQLVDFGHLPVQIPHNLVLLLAGRDRNYQSLKIIVIRVPLSYTNTVRYTVVISFKHR